MDALHTYYDMNEYKQALHQAFVDPILGFIPRQKADHSHIHICLYTRYLCNIDSHVLSLILRQKAIPVVRMRHSHACMCT